MKKIILIALVSSFLYNCQEPGNLVDTNKNPTKNDLRDSVFILSKQLYLWEKNLPNYQTFNIAQYNSPQETMEAIKKLSDKGTDGLPLDKWSFVIDEKTFNNQSSGKLDDFGLFFRFAENNQLYVREVYKASHAGQLNIKRGWRVISVNGKIPERNEASLNILNQELSKNEAEIKFELTNGTIKTHLLKATQYQTDPVQAVKVFNYGNKKIAYLAFMDFLGTTASNDLTQAFNKFNDQKATELIVDLRYNGGGYVYLAQHLANLICPSTANGKVQLSYQYNALQSKYNKSYKFAKTNSIGFEKVVFIITKNSASASELVINALKPVMDVKLVGQTTSGKPVGFPAIPCMGHIVAPVAFKIVNANGTADYYKGFAPDFSAIDELTKELGDSTEASTKTAIELLTLGKPTARINANNKKAASTESISEQLFKKMGGNFVR